MMERDDIEIAAMRAERVEIALAPLRPVDEFDAELIRPLGRLQEFAFVDAERLVEQADRRDRRLADADRADLLGFDQRDGAVAAQHVAEHRRGHPSGGAASDDQDRPDPAVALVYFTIHRQPSTAWDRFLSLQKKAVTRKP